MKRTLEQKQDSSSTTSEVKNKIQIKENSHLFNYIEKLAADHDVYVSNTMIKVTYKKALTDQNASDSSVIVSGKKVHPKSMNHSEMSKKKKKGLCNSDISFITKAPVVHAKGKAIVYHSTPKPQALANEKKKKYVNGLNLSVKPNNEEEKNSPVKVQKGLSSQEDGASSPKKSKTVIKPGVSNRFLLDDNNSLLKAKASIIQRNSADAKKVTLNKLNNKKLKKLENCVKKKIEVEKKGLKRKASNTDLNVLAKKIKVSENKMKEVEGSGKFEERYKLGGGKKPIMLVDPDLPTGWTRYIRTINKGSANEQYVVYIVNPQGKKFRFKWMLRKYLEKTKSSLDVDRFFFGLYRRPKSANASAVNRQQNSKSDTVPVSQGKVSNRSESQRNPSARNSKQDEGSNNDSGKGPEGKELLLFDPDLPFGWKRVIHSNISSGKKQVHIISPDGKIFRRRYRLNEYLIKHQYTHNVDRFYFGLYPKKEGNFSENSGKESGEETLNSVKSNNHMINNNNNNNSFRKGNDGGENKVQMRKDNNYGSLSGNKQLRLILRKIDRSGAYKHDDCVKMDEGAMMVNSRSANERNQMKDESKVDVSSSPMYDDPNLPEGWKRFIKTRSCGESAGRMEVVIVSPDGRRHRSRKHLEHYLLQKELEYKAEDFDFHVFGKASLKKRPESAQESALVPEPEPEPEPELEPEPDPEPNDLTFFNVKKKFTDKIVPELDIDSLKDIKISPEGHMINEVSGLMMSCGLSSARSERRHRLPRGEHEKRLRSHLSSEGDLSCDGCEIPIYWIQRLVKCRGDFRTLEPDAAFTVGEATKDFIKKVSFLALSISKESEGGLRYEDVAELVHGTKSLSPLQTLIPKKITYKEYVRLNRPKQFLSYT